MSENQNTRFWLENLNETTWEDLDIDRIALKLIFKVTGWKCIRWIHLRLDRNQRKVNMVMKPWVTQDMGNCVTSLKTSRPSKMTLPHTLVS
jgi:hypothetical protein